MSSELTYGDFTIDSRTVMARAADEAIRRRSPAVEPVHVLLAILETRNTVLERVLNTLALDGKHLRHIVFAALPAEVPDGRTAANDAPVSPTPSLTPQGQEIIHAAAKEASLLGHRRIDTLHLLLGCLYNPEQPAYTLLTDAGFMLPELRAEALQLNRQFRSRPRHDLRSVVRPSPIFLALVAIMFLSGGLLWSAPFESLIGPITAAFVVSGWLVSVCLHEFGHALAAHLGGDTEVADAGYLSLNPLRFSHPVLSLLLPLVLLMMGGIGLPGGAVYIRTSALRSRHWEIAVAAAGPLGTLVFLLLTMWPFLVPDAMMLHLQMLGNAAFWSALAALGLLQISSLLLNLLPVPPLDGFGVLGPMLPRDIQMQAERVGARLSFVHVFMLLHVGPIMSLFWDNVFYVLALLHIPPELAYDGLMHILW